VPSAPIAEGAECVCVAEISIRFVGIPVFCFARSLARSSNSRGIMQLSTTTIASRFVPSSRTRHLAWIGSFTLVAWACRKPPLTTTGSLRGAMSAAKAPARIALVVPGAGLPSWAVAPVEGIRFDRARQRFTKIGARLRLIAASRGGAIAGSLHGSRSRAGGHSACRRRLRVSHGTEINSRRGRSRRKPGGTAYVIGEGGPLTALLENGYAIVDRDPDDVVVGEKDHLIGSLPLFSLLLVTTPPDELDWHSRFVQ
jgi:hypothetical protein